LSGGRFIAASVGIVPFEQERFGVGRFAQPRILQRIALVLLKAWTATDFPYFG